MDAKIGQSTLGEMLPLFILIFVLLLFIMLCFRMIVVTSKAKKERKKKIQELKNNGMIHHAIFSHLNGLPIAEGVQCEFISYLDRYEIKAGGMDFKLFKSKITDVCIKTDVEIQQQYVSSIGGAVGGAVLFGPIGAMIGGRAKKKETRIAEQFLIITYTNDNEIKYVGFKIIGNLSTAMKIVNEFVNNRPAASTQSIEL